MTKETAELSASLRSAVSALHKRLRKQMYSVATYSITEIITMGYLYRQGAMLPSELAVHTGVKTQSMSQILNKMQEHKLIRREPSKEDGRKVYISLTAHGKKIVEKTRYERDEWLGAAMEQHLTVKEATVLAQSITILEKLSKAI
jgi:DNA-binding MarR family transcriptional regulator